MLIGTIPTSVNYALTLFHIFHLILPTHINLVHANNLSFKHRYKLIPLCVSIYTSFPDYKSYFINIIENLFQHSLITKIYFIFLMINQTLVSHILMQIIMHLSATKLIIKTMRIPHHRMSSMKQWVLNIHYLQKG